MVDPLARDAVDKSDLDLELLVLDGTFHVLVLKGCLLLLCVSIVLIFFVLV